MTLLRVCDAKGATDVHHDRIRFSPGDPARPENQDNTPMEWKSMAPQGIIVVTHRMMVSVFTRLLHSTINFEGIMGAIHLPPSSLQFLEQEALGLAP